MFDLIGKRRWYFIISAILIVPGLLAMIFSTVTTGAPMRLGVDFTSGSSLELAFERPVSAEQVREMVVEAGYSDATVRVVTTDGRESVVIRTRQLEVAESQAVQDRLAEAYGPVTELRFDSVGPTVGRETTRAAVLATVAASVAILFFIAIAFRKVPNAFRYGVCAIAKMMHDAFFLVGIASILGIVANWEIDALFLTAMITVIGFSLEDIIVVFDRIRENTTRRRGEPFETIVNRSLLETLHRSLATQLNAIFIMVAIIFFGGVTIRQFMLVMLIGMVTGTYSSLFFAVPLLVVWEKKEWGRLYAKA